MQKKILEGKWWVVIVAAIVMNFLAISIFHDKPRNTNFIVDGAKNKIISLGAVDLSIPPDTKFSIRQDGNGGVYEFETWRKYSQYFDDPRPMPTEYDSLVRVEIEVGGGERKRDLAEYEVNSNWIRGGYVQDLIEYRRVAGDQTSWGALTYIGAGLEKTPKGNPIIFVCTQSVSADRRPLICRTTWQDPNGPMITYYQSGALLRKWRDIRNDVKAFVDSIIIVK